ncbi:UNKNOWN [Stylonychia lemnae]|uniref:Uncharacterized protein n=1 Tax=Stylonychia lemnae TaxID=5949 RepID=A0A078AJE0_STYLE|nr:UNKNOWN [Stylonychia lemnae]|eukprot:CDW82006.1 UNKNOWN [Stylonychia lemnae]
MNITRDQQYTESEHDRSQTTLAESYQEVEQMIDSQVDPELKALMEQLYQQRQMLMDLQTELDEQVDVQQNNAQAFEQQLNDHIEDVIKQPSVDVIQSVNEMVDSFQQESVDIDKLIEEERQKRAKIAEEVEKVQNELLDMCNQAEMTQIKEDIKKTREERDNLKQVRDQLVVDLKKQQLLSPHDSYITEQDDEDDSESIQSNVKQ